MDARDRIYAYLQQRPDGATTPELFDLLFTSPGNDPELPPRLLELLLAPDPRFCRDEERGRWKLREFAELAQSIDDATFVVADIETTGLDPDTGGIIEIGAARVQRGRIVGQFQRLVRPARRPPPFIVHLTGITWEMLREQPPLEAVWEEFVEFVRGGVFVAHNATFDLGYLNLASRQFSGAPLATTYLCTLQLARRLVPETRKRGLDALASVFGIASHQRHRALGDVRITVDVFFHLLDRARARGISRVDELLALQNKGHDGRPFYCPLPRSVVEEVPSTPGVYRFFDHEDRLLYVGRAKDLHRRVLSYLQNSEHHSAKTLDLVRHIHRVRVQRCASELEAALLEAELIRREKPPYNQRSKHLPRVAYVRIGREKDFPRLSVALRPRAQHDQLVGPLRSREEAERLLRIWLRVYGLRTCRGPLQPAPEVSPCFQGQTGFCTMPCAARIDREEYHERVQALLQDILHGGQHTVDFLIAERERLARVERFEAAEKVHADLVFFERLRARLQWLGWFSKQQHFLLLLPRAGEQGLDAYLVLEGQLLGRTRVYHPGELEPWLCAGLQRPRDPGPRAELVDASTILAAWLRDHRAPGGALFKLPEPGKKWPATLFAEWRAACAALLASPKSVLPPH